MGYGRSGVRAPATTAQDMVPGLRLESPSVGLGAVGSSRGSTGEELVLFMGSGGEGGGGRVQCWGVYLAYCATHPQLNLQPGLNPIQSGAEMALN